MTTIYCDQEDCKSHNEGVCNRTTICIDADASYSGAYCISVNIIKKMEAEKINE